MRTPLFAADLAASAATRFDPETAHRLTVKGLKFGRGPKVRIDDARLRTTVAGLRFPNPLGLAAGFDKNAEVPNAMLDLGFGFVAVSYTHLTLPTILLV